MGCQTEVRLGKNLSFSVVCHDPDTGHLTNADANPAYRVYEDDTDTAILTGTMPRFDSVNTTAFYLKKIAVTTANGFEANKSYNIYVTGVVGGDTGGITFSFKVT